MGLKDRLRETAQQAQEGLARGQAKLEQFQNRQTANEELQALGQAFWVEQSGRGTPEQLQAMLEAVAGPIQEAEGKLGPLPWPAVPTPPQAPAGGTSAPGDGSASSLFGTSVSAAPVPPQAAPPPAAVRSSGGTVPSGIPTAHHDETPPGP